MHGSFIYQSYLKDTSICEQLIAFHEDSPDKKPGSFSVQGATVLDTSIKKSEESLLVGDLADQYMKQIQTIAAEYIEKYPQCNWYSPFSSVVWPQIQKYNPGEGFVGWHTERSHAKTQAVAARHLVFMTYLNDVTDAGETEFSLQNLKVQPRKGLTLVWPVDWTHTHRGVVSPTQTKYIVTGWFHFV